MKVQPASVLPPTNPPYAFMDALRGICIWQMEPQLCILWEPEVDGEAWGSQWRRRRRVLCRTLFCVYVLGGGQVGVEVTLQKAVGVGSALPLGLPLSDQAPRQGQRDGERTKARESRVGCSLHAAAVECDGANGSTHMYVTMVSLRQAWDAWCGKCSFITVGNVRDMAHFRNATLCIFNDHFSMGKVLADICHWVASLHFAVPCLVRLKKLCFFFVQLLLDD